MKAFEEWREKNAVSGRSHKADARVWRAALEWVRQSDRVWMEDLNKDIDQELGEGE